MKKDIVLVTNFWHFECEKLSSRYRSLAGILTEHGYDLEIITSNFYHRTKQKRSFDDAFLKSFNYKVTLLNEPAYKKNISLKRLAAHKIFSRNVLKYLNTRKKPDVVIAAIPSTYVAKAVARYCNENGVPMILDIQDLWPEAFSMAFHVPVISDIAFYPLKRAADYAYKNADYITAVSETYVERGMRCNKKNSRGSAIYLGADFQYAEIAINETAVKKPDDEFWVTYIGALGYSYNIKLVIDAIAVLNERGLKNIIFNVFGNGVLEEEFQRYSTEKNVRARFFGHIEYGEMIAYLSHSDIAVNPIMGRSVASIINKVCDYAAAGVPVVNDQNSGEYRELLERYQCGISCRNNDTTGFADAIEQFYHDREMTERMRENALCLAVEKFDRNKTYPEYIKIINSLCI